MITPSFLSGASLSVLLCGLLSAQTHVVNTELFGTPINDSGGTALTAGLTAADGDGAVVQVGYFNVSNGAGGYNTDITTYGAADWNSFVALTGNGSDNPWHNTTIGDEGSGAVGPFGLFGHPIVLEATDAPGLPDAVPTDNNLPTSTFPARLGIRIFNGTSWASSTEYNTVSSNFNGGGSNNGWLLQAAAEVPTPTDSALLNLDLGGILWESETLFGTGNGTFVTAIAMVPEPSQVFLTFLGSLLLALRRRR